MDEKTMELPYYVLKIYINELSGNIETNKKYSRMVQSIQEKINLYKSGKNIHMDAGFDLFIPNSQTINSQTYSNKINHGIKCAMTFNNTPTAFYLYPRSSTGSKTPLRLSNSVGIIDSGYRGDIIALFDNFSNDNYHISINDRLVQICGPNIMYPIYPVLVSNVEDLGITLRGSNGFGSSGQ